MRSFEPNKREISADEWLSGTGVGRGDSGQIRRELSDEEWLAGSVGGADNTERPIQRGLSSDEIADRLRSWIREPDPVMESERHEQFDREAVLAEFSAENGGEVLGEELEIVRAQDQNVYEIPKVRRRVEFLIKKGCDFQFAPNLNHLPCNCNCDVRFSLNKLGTVEITTEFESATIFFGDAYRRGRIQGGDNIHFNSNLLEHDLDAAIRERELNRTSTMVVVRTADGKLWQLEQYSASEPGSFWLVGLDQFGFRIPHSSRCVDLRHPEHCDDFVINDLENTGVDWYYVNDLKDMTLERAREREKDSLTELEELKGPFDPNPTQRVTESESDFDTQSTESDVESPETKIFASSERVVSEAALRELEENNFVLGRIISPKPPERSQIDALQQNLLRMNNAEYFVTSDGEVGIEPGLRSIILSAMEKHGSFNVEFVVDNKSVRGKIRVGGLSENYLSFEMDSDRKIVKVHIVT